VDCGLVFEKCRGSLTKLAGRTGTFYLEMLDRDRVAKIPRLVLRCSERRRGTGARSPRRRQAEVGQTWPSRLHLGRDQALEVEHDTVNSSRRSRWRIRARIGAPLGEGGAAHGSEGNALAQRERGREKGYGASLTTPGSCDDG
jgi:hypothetical protein